MSEIVLSVENLETSFFLKGGQAKVVNGISYTVSAGQTVGIVGESGCGKSVTSLSILRLLEHPGRITGGKVFFRNTELTSLSERDMQGYRGGRMAMIFQEPMTALNPVYTLGFQIDEQIRRHRRCSVREARERTLEMLDLVGIPAPSQRYECYPHQLSGGMRQRGMIAMALSCDPEFLIADEPTTALDVTIQAQILELIHGLQEKFRMAVQFITHDLAVISEVADTVLVMYAGRICESASAELIFSHPRHPYTVALLESIPRIGSRLPRLCVIRGTAPAVLDLPPGCPFQNRCPNVIEECRFAMPELNPVAPGHAVACFNMK